ncbi:hypothetical protein DH2020_003215 [Rehmannia glutinosa]|uniref:TRF2/HOY1 PH-like domain-containing protein n=1 Tax=Rehmannia glutinosa TaxID=99300 RepID=A0ABR0XL59_REHGL
MGESEDSEFWSDGGIFTCDDFESGSQSINDQESGSKRIRLSPEFNHQEGDADSSGQSSPLGLTLIFLKIGVWQRTTRHEGDLTAKLYFAKRKLVWEVLDGGLKSKIEIQWSDIIAIRAVTPHNEPGTLEIELNQSPLFYREINPQPRKHTLWQQASDFTGGQAPIWRRHYVRFPPGILDKHYEKLLQCDQRLFALSQKPFPRHESPYFDPTMFGISQLSLSFNGYGTGYPHGMQYPYHTYPTTPGAPLGLVPNSTLPVMDLPVRNGGENNNQFMSQTQTPWYEGPFVSMRNMINNQGPSHINSATPGNHVFHSQNYQPNVGLLNDIENHLLGESQFGSSDEGTYRTNVETMCSLLEPSNVNVNYHANHSGLTNYQIMDSTSDDHQVMQNGRYNMNPILDGLIYSERVNDWLPTQENNDSIVMEQTVNNNSLPPPFMFLKSNQWRLFLN